jgi:hypothetical protein
MRHDRTPFFQVIHESALDGRAINLAPSVFGTVERFFYNILRKRLASGAAGPEVMTRTRTGSSLNSGFVDRAKEPQPSWDLCARSCACHAIMVHPASAGDLVSKRTGLFAEPEIGTWMNSRYMPKTAFGSDRATYHGAS